MPFMGISEGIVLIAIIAGYMAILRARKEDKKFLRALGYVIGTVTILLGIVLLFESLMGDYQFYKAFLGSTAGYSEAMPVNP
jgi:uncharacterized membrane protein HdeD (DUF308 family)